MWPTRTSCSIEVARLLDEEKVIGWFHGRMEYGPRALGARSILGDARSPRMQQVMNLKIKFRESFRPFAPCVLREPSTRCSRCARRGQPVHVAGRAGPRRVATPLDAEDRERMQTPICASGCRCRDRRVPAVTHVDYSARIQTVDPERHGRFYRLMRRFYERTGCPVIVNTSFNIRGEPIVCTPGGRLPLLHGDRHGLSGSRESHTAKAGPAPSRPLRYGTIQSAVRLRLR